MSEPDVWMLTAHSHPRASYSDAFYNAYTSNAHGTL